MKDSKIALRAAKNIFKDQSEFSCCALGMDGEPTRKEYIRLFAPNQRPQYCWLDNAFDTEKERKEWRLTALCLFAAMLEAEGR